MTLPPALHRLLLPLLWLCAACCALPARAVTLEIRSALSAPAGPDSGNSYPVQAQGRMLTLPDEWAQSHPG